MPTRNQRAEERNIDDEWKKQQEANAVFRICWGRHHCRKEVNPSFLLQEGVCFFFNNRMKANGFAFKFWERISLSAWKEVLKGQWVLIHNLIAEKCMWSTVSLSHPKITSLLDFPLSDKRSQPGLFGEQGCCSIPRSTEGFKVTNCKSSGNGGLVYGVMQLSQLTALSSIEITLCRTKQADF